MKIISSFTFRFLLYSVLLFLFCSPLIAQSGMVSPPPGLSGSFSYVLSRTMTNERGTMWLDHVDYDNGLGQAYQRVDVGITPDGNDLVTLQEYDELGRPVRSWLPGLGSGGSCVDAGALKQSSCSLSGDAAPYTQNTYEVSPLSRLTSETLPGADWHQNGKKHEHTYNCNAPELPEFCMEGGELWYYKNRRYGSLTTHEVRDESGTLHVEYADADGHVVVKADLPPYYDPEVITYYVYDDCDRLRFVLPPEAYRLICNQYRSSSPCVVSASNSSLTTYGYEYRYDGRGNCIYKRLPGCSPVYYIYDRADRCIFSQDGAQRERNGSEWRFTIPDILGRPVLTGTCIRDFSYTDMPLRNTVVTASRTDGGYMGYAVDGVDLADDEEPVILSASYYDDYSFLGLDDIPQEALVYDHSGYGSMDDSPRSLLTGTATAKLPCSADDPEYLFSAIYYDNRGRVIQQKSTNSLGGTESEYILLDFTGKAQARRHVHTAPSKASVTEEYAYEYDHAGRLLSTDYRLNGGSSVTLSSNEYDALGRLSSTQQGSGISTGYAYNVRSWLTSINSGQLFSERLYYNESRGRGSTPDYRGNISSMEWQAGGGSSRSYDFIYDYHSRLKQASYAEGSVQNGHYDTYYSYDNMGNMLSLRRSGLQDGGEYGVIDDVTFTYNGNRLIRAEDDADDPTYAGAFNFRDGEDETVEYEYDANGNLISDLNKGISSVSYNLLNLPEKVTFSNGSYERFIYSADGRKLQTSSYTFSGRRYLSPRKPPQRPKVKLKTTTYCGNIIYEDGALSQILFEGGYATLDDDGIPQYHFYLRDHLGNNRVVARSDGTIEQVNHYYPFGGLMGESTGGDEQRYKYNGKELDRMHGLDWFDYGARMYDGLRFTTMDPLAEDYYPYSPYAYCVNNPVILVDPDGRSLASKGGRFLLNVGKSVSKNGLKALNKVDTYTSAFKEIKEDFNTLMDENASTWDRVKAGVSLASEVVSPVSMNDVKAIKKVFHGNSKLSTKAQHSYDIINTKTNKIVKVGVSGGPIRKDGKSVRAETQVRKWNKQEGAGTYRSEITHIEPEGKGARAKILKYEKDRSNKYRKDLQTDNKHKRP